MRWERGGAILGRVRLKVGERRRREKKGKKKRKEKGKEKRKKKEKCPGKIQRQSTSWVKTGLRLGVRARD